MASESEPERRVDSAGEPPREEVQEARVDPGPLELEILFGSEDRQPRDDQDTKP
jgi:hypothetical protein